MQPRYVKGDNVSLGPMVGSTLAMLAFVLAITFSMAASRYDQRKQNLPAEPNKTAIQQYLIEYVDLDRPADIGLVKVNQVAMMDLRNRLEPGTR